MKKAKLIVISIVLILATITQAVSDLNKKKTDKSIQSPVKRNAVTPIHNILVDDDVWPYFNWAAFDQDKIVSYGNFQYSIYWDSDTVLVIVRRNLKDNSIQTLRFPEHKLTVNPKDGHRKTGIATRLSVSAPLTAVFIFPGIIIVINYITQNPKKDF